MQAVQDCQNDDNFVLPLPIEIVERILSQVDFDDLLCARLACKAFIGYTKCQFGLRARLVINNRNANLIENFLRTTNFPVRNVALENIPVINAHGAFCYPLPILPTPIVDLKIINCNLTEKNVVRLCHHFGTKSIAWHDRHQKNVSLPQIIPEFWHMERISLTLGLLKAGNVDKNWQKSAPPCKIISLEVTALDHQWGVYTTIEPVLVRISTNMEHLKLNFNDPNEPRKRTILSTPFTLTNQNWSKLKSLEAVVYQHVVVNVGHFKSIASQLQNLKSVTLMGDYISLEDDFRLWCEECVNLEEFFIVRSECKYRRVPEIGPAHIAHLPKLKKLKKLQLYNPLKRINSSVTGAFAEMSDRLEHLELNKVMFSPRILNLVTKLKKLKYLKMSAHAKTLCKKQTTDIFANLIHLETLDLTLKIDRLEGGYCTESEDSWTVFNKFIQGYKGPDIRNLKKLQHIRIRSNYHFLFPWASMQKIAECSRLISIDVEYSQYEYVALEDLKVVEQTANDFLLPITHCERLRSFNISGCRKDQLNSITQQLGGMHPDLRRKHIKFTLNNKRIHFNELPLTAN